jgi:hypothetical protein
MSISFTKNLCFAGALCFGFAASGFGQVVPLAEKRTITVGAEQRTIVSKLSAQNPNTTRVRAVMDLNFTYNYHHQLGKPVLADLLDRLATSEGWTVTHYYYADLNHSGVDDRTKITLTELNKNIVVVANQISNWASTGNSGTGATNNLAVRNYLMNTGGGVLVMHGSGDSPTGSTWKFYTDTLHPVLFTGHGNIVSGRVIRTVSAANHPVMEGGILQDSLTLSGEWHRFTKLITTVNTKAEPLFKVNWNTCSGCYTADNQRFYLEGGTPGNPVAWTMPVGKGWVGYFQEGHDATTRNQMTGAIHDKFFKQMIYYIAGYDTLPATGIVRPSYARDRSGISFNPRAMEVFIDTKGAHRVSVWTLSGLRVSQVSGFGRARYGRDSEALGMWNPKSGVYVMTVESGKTVSSRKYIIN